MGRFGLKKIHEEGEGHDKHINYFEAPQIEPIGDNFIWSNSLGVNGDNFIWSNSLGVDKGPWIDWFGFSVYSSRNISSIFPRSWN